MGKGVGGVVRAAKSALKRAMDESVRRSAAKAGPPTPAPRGTVARAGGYASPIDTAGVDASMKKTLGVGGEKGADDLPFAQPGRDSKDTAGLKRTPSALSLQDTVRVSGKRKKK